MSFGVPKNVPNFGAPHRDLEDQAWATISQHGGHRGSRLLNGVQRKWEAGFSPQQGLPMYKDKPRAYAPSERRCLWLSRKRNLSIVGLGLLALLYLSGILPGNKTANSIVSPSSQLSSLRHERSMSWEQRRQHVVKAFEVSWDAYERHAWGQDNFHPLSKTGDNMAPKGLGWIIIDSLDTLMLMNQTHRLDHARRWLSENLTWDQDQDVNTFETTIRMLGGLLSAHYLSTEFPELVTVENNSFPNPEDLYLEKAKDLADRLLSAFDTPSGIPFASVNLAKFEGISSHMEKGASSTAEATSLQLEFKYLAKLTGERHFWDKVENVMQVLDKNQARDGLVPIFIHPDTGKFAGDYVRLGSRGDSYYEYLIKQFLQTNKQESVYREMWEEALQGVRNHLLTYTESEGFAIIGERPTGLDGELEPKMDHLVCFMPGTIALAATEGLSEAEARTLPSWSEKKEQDMTLARELMHTCWGTYKYMATGLAAEITRFNIHRPPIPGDSPPARRPSQILDPDPVADWRRDFEVRANDRHNLQRPETVESLFYMWRITGDSKYRDWGWEMFICFMEYTAVEDRGGFTSLRDAHTIPPKELDNMESFWLAETLKYFYLLFSPDELLPLDKIVINTEAHPLPRFDMGSLFSTGWKREPRHATDAPGLRHEMGR